MKKQQEQEQIDMLINDLQKLVNEYKSSHNKTYSRWYRIDEDESIQMKRSQAMAKWKAISSDNDNYEEYQTTKNQYIKEQMKDSESEEETRSKVVRSKWYRIDENYSDSDSNQQNNTLINKKNTASTTWKRIDLSNASDNNNTYSKSNDNKNNKSKWYRIDNDVNSDDNKMTAAYACDSRRKNEKRKIYSNWKRIGHIESSSSSKEEKTKQIKTLSSSSESD